LKPLPQSLVTEKFTLAWGKVALVEELVPRAGVGVGVATGVGAGVGEATGVGAGVGVGVEVPLPEGLPIRGARLDCK
jgi:hypothetical protein